MPSVKVSRLPAEMPEMYIGEHEVLEGVPDCRGLFTAESADQGASAGFWSCDVGRYEFLFDYDEFVYIIAGEMLVTECQPGGRSYRMKAGDTAHFPQGLTTIWHIKSRLTKYFVARAPF